MRMRPINYRGALRTAGRFVICVLAAGYVLTLTLGFFRHEPPRPPANRILPSWTFIQQVPPAVQNSFTPPLPEGCIAIVGDTTIMMCRNGQTEES